MEHCSGVPCDECSTSAFGINAYTAPNAGDDVVEEHAETSLGHEEIYIVLNGRATFTLDEETLDAPAGTMVFIHDPAVKRHARAEEPGTSVLAVGGPHDGAYEPSPWEHLFAAEKHRVSGDFEAMATEIARGLEQHPTTRVCSTSSAAQKRLQAVRRMPSGMCGARSSSSRSGRKSPAKTRIS